MPCLTQPLLAMLVAALLSLFVAPSTSAQSVDVGQQLAYLQAIQCYPAIPSLEMQFGHYLITESGSTYTVKAVCDAGASVSGWSSSAYCTYTGSSWQWQDSGTGQAVTPPVCIALSTAGCTSFTTNNQYTATCQPGQVALAASVFCPSSTQLTSSLPMDDLITWSATCGQSTQPQSITVRCCAVSTDTFTQHPGGAAWLPSGPVTAQPAPVDGFFRHCSLLHGATQQNNQPSASCANGKVVIAGGVNCDGQSITASQATVGGSGQWQWQGKCTSSSGNPEAVALCCDPVPSCVYLSNSGGSAVCGAPYAPQAQLLQVQSSYDCKGTALTSIDFTPYAGNLGSGPGWASVSCSSPSTSTLCCPALGNGAAEPSPNWCPPPPVPLIGSLVHVPGTPFGSAKGSQYSLLCDSSWSYPDLSTGSVTATCHANKTWSDLATCQYFDQSQCVDVRSKLGSVSCPADGRNWVIMNAGHSCASSLCSGSSSAWLQSYSTYVGGTATYIGECSCTGSATYNAPTSMTATCCPTTAAKWLPSCGTSTAGGMGDAKFNTYSGQLSCSAGRFAIFGGVASVTAAHSRSAHPTQQQTTHQFAHSCLIIVVCAISLDII